MNHSDSEKIDWASSIPFILLHVAVIGVFFVPFSGWMVLLCAFTYGIRMFGITAGYHRYFAHRTYKMNRFFQFLMAWLGSTAVQKGVLWWAAHHRHHHIYSDEPQDVHSPRQKGFWWAHVGWILCRKFNETQWSRIPDLAVYPELRWLNRYHLVPPVLMSLMLLALGGWSAFFWGFVLSTVLLWHGTFCINSIAHIIGSRRYATRDDSRNSLICALITLGEGWHNNHHAYMASANQGFYWWEIDLSYYTLKVLSWLKITRDLRKPPLPKLESLRIFEDAAAQTVNPPELHPGSP